MVPKESLTIPKSLAKLITVWVCLCAFLLFSSPQIAGACWLQNTQEEAPAEEDGKGSEEGREVLSSARDRVKKRRLTVICRLLNSSKCPPQISPFASANLAIIGHQLANGLCAPLLV